MESYWKKLELFFEYMIFDDWMKTKYKALT